MTTNETGTVPSRRTSRKWHVISELDLMRLVADHSQLEQMCSDLLDAIESTFQLSIRLRDLLDTTLIPHARNEEQWLDERLAGEGAPAVARALLDTVRAGHSAMIHGCRRLANALEATQSMPWGLVSDFVGHCRQSMMLEALAISYLAGHRLTPEARELLESSMVSLQTGRVDA